MAGKNAVPRYRLALVKVDPRGAQHDQVRYLDNPFATVDLGDFDATGIRGDWPSNGPRGRRRLMSARSERKRRQKARRYEARDGQMDQHVEVVLDSTVQTAELLSDVLKSTNPQAEVEKRIDDAAKQFVASLADYDPLGALEAIRMMTLPFGPSGAMQSAGAQSGPAVSEILAVALLCAAPEIDANHDAKRVDQELCGAISERLIPLAHELLNLATVRDLLAADKFDDMTQVAAFVRGNGRWMRGTSYPEMQDETLRGLFGTTAIDTGLRSVLGFGVEDALSFLNACHQIQMDQLNTRSQGLADAFNPDPPFGFGDTRSEMRKVSL